MKKQDFTIEGSEALKKAFVEESGMDISQIDYLEMLTNSKIKDKAITSRMTHEKEGMRFILPQQYNEALEYVKNFWEEEKPEFKVGDWVRRTWTDGDIDLFQITGIESQKYRHALPYFRNGSALTLSTSETSIKDNRYKDRHATPEEIKEATSFKDGEYLVYIKEVQLLNKDFRVGVDIGSVEKLIYGEFSGFKIYGFIDCSSCFRRATKEEIEAVKSQIISVSGQFDVKVTANGIWHNTDNITKFVEGILNLGIGGSCGNYGYNVSDVIFSKTGCQNKETKLSDWRKVWEEYQRVIKKP